MARRGRPKGRSTDAGPNPVDVHVGKRLRLRRTMLGFSQEKLGEAIGLTFQQVQKYERGTNRIGSSRLFDLSRVLDVEVGYFFEDMPRDVANSSPAKRQGGWSDGDQVAFEHQRDPMVKRETLELVRAYFKIEDESIRKRLFEMTKALGMASRRAKGAQDEKKKRGRPKKPR